MTAVTPERGEGLTTVRVPLSATNDMIQSINAWMDDPAIDGDDLYNRILGHYARPYSSAAPSPATDEVSALRDALFQADARAKAPEAGLRDAMRAAFMAGAESVHEYWHDNPGEPPAPRDDPDFGEAADDYARTTLASMEEGGT